MEYRDYYAILGVPKTASQAEIKNAYRKLARELHPDRNPGDKEAERRFKEANEAHAVLSDPEKRKQYDELGANWQAYQQAGDFTGRAASDWAGFGGAPGGTRWTYQRVNPEEMGGFSDFFRAFFGGGGGGFGGSGFGGGGFGGGGGGAAGAGRGGAARGGFEYVDLSDLGGRGGRTATRARPAAEATAEVTLAEVASGAQRMVNVDGRRLQVTIPPGVSDGSKVRLSGAIDGGDLVITVKVLPDPRFERHGADLTTELPVTLSEALLGGEVRVPTLNGSVKLRIRPNTQNGQEIRLAGRGLPKRGKTNEKGDLLVRVRVVLPKLDEEAREEFARFAAAHPQPNPRAS
jgi:curved DNA-binding protein